MMKRTILMVIFFTLTTTSASEVDSQTKPSVPFVERHVCPFEFGCKFHKWYVRAAVKGYTVEGDTTAPSFQVAPAESLQFNYGNMYIERLGVVLVRKPIEDFKLGDTVYVLGYTGEGGYDVWHRGRMKNVECFWEADTSYQGYELVEVSMSWWVNVTDTNARTFWLRLFNTAGSHGIGFAEDIQIVQIGFENY